MSDPFLRLLAKGSKNPDRPSEHETLPGHLSDVLGVMRVLAAMEGVNALKTLALTDIGYEELYSILVRVAFMHDLGKANSAFQAMVRRRLGGAQPFRHEILSTWLLYRHEAFRSWLFRCCPDDFCLLSTAAVLGHHLKFEDLGGTLSPTVGSGLSAIQCNWSHPDFDAALQEFAKAEHLSTAPSLPHEVLNLSADPLAGFRRSLLHQANQIEDLSSDRKRLLALLKALLIAADVAGSALPRNGRDAAWWAEEVLSRRCLPAEYEQAAASGAKGGKYRPFQIEVSESTSRVTFVRAGCGSGKTTAAYLWASRHPERSRLYVCYPTTGTATEGFRDYIADNVPPHLSALLHGRSEVDLEILFETNEEDSIASLQRINALESWDAPMVVCTVDRVLGIIQNSRLPLFGTPTLMNAAFVFDEIHLYDDRLFGALLHFLRIFRGAPVLLMTASLPAARLDAIRGVLAAQGEELSTVAGDSRLESLERYRFRGLVDDPIEDIRETIGSGGKVLWVSNTVRQCVRAFTRLRAEGMDPIPYHSRYRYIDRLKQHGAVIGAFRATAPALAVTTQVCEVSLDLPADLLVTEIAPIPALIQRLGRLNRRASPDQPTGLREAVFLRPPYSMPYEHDDLALASKWMNSLVGRPLSQRDLAESFEALCSDSPPAPVNCAWLDGGLLSSQAPLRDAGTTIPVVRGEDRDQCLENGGRIIRTEVLKNTIPMPLGPVAKEIPSWTRAAIAFIAPAGRISYDPLLGATWTTTGAD